MAKYPDWIYRQSAALPYRRVEDALELLLITSRKGGRWVLPKGIVEPGLTAAASAAKEAREEAGVEGRVFEESLGSYEYEKWGGTCRVEVFPMRVDAESPDWPEASLRRRKWTTLKKAEKRIAEEALRAIIHRLPEAIQSSADSGQRRFAAKSQPGRVVYLFRHAKSSWADPTLDDFDRPLAGRGRRAAENMRRYLRLADVRPGLVLCSPAERARETLRSVQPVLGDPVIRFESGLYLVGERVLMQRLHRVPDEVTSVMMIGHDPGFHDLARSLSGSGDPDASARLEVKFPTAGLATLVLKRDHWQDLEPGACELHSFVVPRQLE